MVFATPNRGMPLIGWVLGVCLPGCSAPNRLGIRGHGDGFPFRFRSCGVSKRQKIIIRNDSGSSRFGEIIGEDRGFGGMEGGGGASGIGGREAGRGTRHPPRAHKIHKVFSFNPPFWQLKRARSK